jgi:large subunit ribosomal protein L31
MPLQHEYCQKSPNNLLRPKWARSGPPPLSGGPNWKNHACHWRERWYFFGPFMKADIHPKYVDAEIRCACGNVIKTRSTKPVVIVGICNACHPFYTGQQKFVDTAGRVDKFQQRMVKTQAAQAAAATRKKKK